MSKRFLKQKFAHFYIRFHCNLKKSFQEKVYIFLHLISLQLEKSFQKQNFAHFDTIEHTSENFTLDFTQERHYYKKKQVILTKKSSQGGPHLDRHKNTILSI